MSRRAEFKGIIFGPKSLIFSPDYSLTINNGKNTILVINQVNFPLICVLFYRFVYINHRFQTVYLFASRLSQVVYTCVMFEI